MIQKMRMEDFDKVFSIMKTSFPLDEYRTYQEQKDLLRNPKYSVYVLPDAESEDIKAFITVWQFEDFAHIEHFAVNRKYRNQGLGSLILREIGDLLACQICLEVELPESDLAKRRIEFYKRNGFFINDYSYIQPPISEGRNPLPLIIMTSKDSITKERFEEIKAIIYREVYKVH